MKTHRFSASFAVVASLIFVATLTTSARAQMSDTEKKAAARAAYQEGVKLQDEGKAAEALVRFEAAEKFFEAPTVLLHLAECQALTGRLVEASETYETLARKTLPAGSPDAFVQAQQQGQAELAPLRARVPSLRVTTKPGPQQVQNLSINVNGVSMPVELLGIARPLNPGTYRFSAQAAGWATAAPIDVPLGEKEQKSVELTLVQGAPGAAAVIVPPPAAGMPPPYTANNADQPPAKAKAPGPTSTGLLLGIRGGAAFPGGESLSGAKVKNAASTGGAFGIDGYLRLAKMLLLGATFEYAGFGSPDVLSTIPAGTTVKTSAHATYVGLNLGLISNADRVAFIGDVGLGSRALTTGITGGGAAVPDSSATATGLEFALGAGLSIPAGPIRVVPRMNLGVGSFGSVTSKGAGADATTDIPSANRGTHTFVFIGLAAYYSIDIGQKTE